MEKASIVMGKDGIARIIYPENTVLTLDRVRADVKELIDLGLEQSAGVLVDLSRVKGRAFSPRMFLISDEVQRVYQALAFVESQWILRLKGALSLLIHPPGYPVRFFSTQTRAMGWLQGLKASPKGWSLLTGNFQTVAVRNKPEFRSEQQDQELEQMASFVLLNPSPVVRISSDGTIIMANPAASHFFYRETLRNKKWPHLCSGITQEEIKELSGTGKSFQREHQLYGKTLLVQYLSQIGSDFINIYSLDVSELRATQQQLVQASKLAALGQMSAGMAHEINNPLTYIKGFSKRIKAELTKKGEIDWQKIADYFSDIDEGCNRISEIIRNSRDYVRESTGNMTQVSLDQIIEKSIRLVSDLMKHRSIKMVRTSEYNDVKVLGDAIQLEQVLINLFTNAADAIDSYRAAHKETNRGKIEVASELHQDTVMIKVTDDGGGISEEDQTKIFDPFFTTKEVGKGTGLGLSLSHRLILNHKGELKCESEVGTGATFIVTLPRSHTGSGVLLEMADNKDKNSMMR